MASIGVDLSEAFCEPLSCREAPRPAAEATVGGAAQRFVVSRAEIVRRAWAFGSLAGAWLAGLVIAWAVVPAGSRPFMGVMGLAVGVALLLIGLASMGFLFKRHLHTRLEIEQGELRRVTPRAEYRIALAGVRQIRVKRTLCGAIRQLSLTDALGRTHNFDAVDDFEGFWRTIGDSCPGAPVKTVREPLEFDHWSFYPVLGVVLACVVAGLVLTLTAADWVVLLVAGSCAVVPTLAVAVYFAIATPLARQYGARARAGDFLLAGVLAVLAAAAVFALVFSGLVPVR